MFDRLRTTIAHAIRALRMRMARSLVGGLDCMVVNKSAWQVAIDKLAALSEWSHNTTLSKRLTAVHEQNVEDVTRMLALAAEVADPSLSFEQLRDRYVNMRLRAMSRKRRQKLEYEQALRQLEARTAPKPPLPSALPEVLNAQ